MQPVILNTGIFSPWLSLSTKAISSLIIGYIYTTPMLKSAESKTSKTGVLTWFLIRIKPVWGWNIFALRETDSGT
jgi:hypothetical protein